MAFPRSPPFQDEVDAASAATLNDLEARAKAYVDAQLRVALAAEPDALVVGAITRDATGAAISASIVWPDGTTGTYTATVVSTAFPGSVDAYTLTYGAHTFTQPAVTRDANGAVTIRPAITYA